MSRGKKRSVQYHINECFNLFLGVSYTQDAVTGFNDQSSKMMKNQTSNRNRTITLNWYKN